MDEDLLVALKLANLVSMHTEAKSVDGNKLQSGNMNQDTSDTAWS